MHRLDPVHAQIGPQGGSVQRLQEELSGTSEVALPGMRHRIVEGHVDPGAFSQPIRENGGGNGENDSCGKCGNPEWKPVQPFC